jgi:hypothetical protein
MEIIAWVQNNWLTIVALYTSIVGVASIIVQLTPTLADDNVLKGVIKFVGKYIALNTDKGSSPKP